MQIHHIFYSSSTENKVVLKLKQVLYTMNYPSYFSHSDCWTEQLAHFLNRRVSIYNLTQNKYLYYNVTYQTALNRFSNDMLHHQHSPDYFFRFLSRRDASLVSQTIREAASMMESVSECEHRNYRMILDVCLKYNQEKWFRVIHQSIVYSQDYNDQIILCWCALLNEQSYYTPLLRQLIHIPLRKFCWKPKKSQGNYLFLTPREMEVVGLITQGYESNRIAQKLSISHNTVCNHRQNILGKLNLNHMSRVSLYLSDIGII